MDRPIVEEKLESLRHCVLRLQAKCPSTAVLLAENEDLQDIVAMNLARAVQLCVDIAAHIVAESDLPAPNTMAESFELLQRLGVLGRETADKMKKAVGFRNIAVHSYEKIDWEIVYSVCRHRLADFSEFAHSIAGTLDKG